MIYYTKDNNKIFIPNSILNKENGHGKCGTVYKYNDDLCIKIYNRGIDFDHCLLNTDIYEDLKKIKSDNLVDIKMALYKDKENSFPKAPTLVSWFKFWYPSSLKANGFCNFVAR